MDFDPPSPRDGEFVERHVILADINELAPQLISALRIQREPDIKRAILFFDAFQPEFAVPEFIRRNIAADSTVEQITIDATVNRLTSESELCVRVDVTGIEGVFMSISVDKSTADILESSLIINDLEVPFIEPATRIELNRFLASLFVKNKTGDYSAFDTMDVANSSTAERLIEALQDVAAESVLDETYFLGKTIGLTTDSVRYTLRDEKVQDATVSIEHHAKASTLELNFAKRPETEMPNFDIDDPEFMMQSLERARTYEQDVDGEAKQVESTNDFLIVVRDFLKEQSGQVFQPSAEQLGDNDVNVVDPTLSMNFEDRTEN